jgi:hypothetical protein
MWDAQPSQRRPRLFVPCAPRAGAGVCLDAPRQDKSLSGARDRAKLDCLGVAAAGGQGKPWIAFAAQKFTGSGFDERSDHLQQGLLLRTTTSREEVSQLDLGDVSTGGDVRLVQHEHSARCIFAQMPAISIWAAVELSHSSSIHGACSTDTTLVGSPCSGPAEPDARRRHRLGFCLRRWPRHKVERTHGRRWPDRLRPRLQARLRRLVSKGLGSPYGSGRSRDWLKMKNPNAPAVKREAEEDWGRG